MFPFFGGGGIESLIFPLVIYGVFFTINLVIQLVTGGLSDLFPTDTPM